MEDGRQLAGRVSLCFPWTHFNPGIKKLPLNPFNTLSPILSPALIPTILYLKRKACPLHLFKSTDASHPHACIELPSNGLTKSKENLSRA